MQGYGKGCHRTFSHNNLFIINKIHWDQPLFHLIFQDIAENSPEALIPILGKEGTAVCLLTSPDNYRPGASRHRPWTSPL